MTEAFVDSVVFCSLGIFLVLTKGSRLLFSLTHCDILTPLRLFARVGYLLFFIIFNFYFLWDVFFCVEHFSEYNPGWTYCQS